jgi:hypothetical protein
MCGLPVKEQLPQGEWESDHRGEPQSEQALEHELHRLMSEIGASQSQTEAARCGGNLRKPKK